MIERDGDSAVEFVELAGFGLDEAAIFFERLEDGAGQGRVEFFEKLQINDADAVAIGSQTIAARFIQSWRLSIKLCLRVASF